VDHGEPNFRPPAPSADRLDEVTLRPGMLVAEKYRLVRAAGFGGMSAVWAAKNEATSSEVAVKLLLADRAASKEAQARFRREAHAAAALSHRGIVRIYDLIELTGADAGSMVLVMELLKGKTLQALLDVSTKLSYADTLELLAPVLSALSHAHQQGVVHRDLKPENIFLARDPDGRTIPKILDFGISQVERPYVPRITGDGHNLGTPGYMAPEQARGSRATDARSDVFAMGILFYECLSGANPFKGDSYHEVVAAILERTPAPLVDVPEPLRKVIERALEKQPSARYADAGEMLTAIRAAVARPLLSSGASFSFEFPVTGEGVALTSSGAPPEERDTTHDELSVRSRRRGTTPRWLAVAALGTVALGGVVGFGIVGPRLGSGSALAPASAASPAPRSGGVLGAAPEASAAAPAPRNLVAPLYRGAPGPSAKNAMPVPAAAPSAAPSAITDAPKGPARPTQLRAPGF
jgi:serine/threonine protein kinase